MNILKLKVITPKKVALTDDVMSVSIPTDNGEITILPHHMNLFTLITEGIIKIKKNSGDDFLAIGGGYLQTDGELVTILVSRAYGQHEIDLELTKKAVDEAQKIISQTKDINQRAEANAMLRRSIINLKLLKKRRKTTL